MNKIPVACLVALVLGSTAVAQSIPSVFPRVMDAADNPSPTGIIGWHWYKLATHRRALPATATMPATAKLVHLTYGDTDNFVPRLEYRRSINGGLDFQAPQVLHTFAQGEVVPTGDTYRPALVCDGDNVFLVFRSNLHDVTQMSVAVYCYGSNDRGATWQGPLLMSPGITGTNPTLVMINGTPSGPDYAAAAAGGRLHVVFEALFTGANLPVLEECFYSSAEFDLSGKLVARKADVRITAFSTPNQFDVDYPTVAADGSVVAITWVDDRTGSGNAANKTFLRVSTDGGDNWGSEVDLDGTTGGNPSTDAPQVAVFGNNIYATYQDARNGNGDNVFLAYSKDQGKTWVRTDKSNNLLLLSSSINVDVDQVRIAAFNNTVSVAWMEEPGPGGANTANIMFVTTDVLGGIGFSNQQTTPVNVSGLVSGAGDVQIVQNICVSNNVIAVAGEFSTGESTSLSWSHDTGKTWSTARVSDGKRDVDEPWVAVTLNGDINMTYLEDFSGGNTGNKTVVTGFKIPTLDHDPNPQGLVVRGASASAGGFAVVLFSDKIATGSNLPLPVNNMGFEINLVPGLVMNVGINVALSNPSVYIATVGPNGDIKFPGIPNFSSLIGVPIHAAVATVSKQGTPLEFTDPLKLR